MNRILLGTMVFLMTMSTSISAATFTVTNTTDNEGALCPDNTNQCSLRQAINAANNSPDGIGPDKIVFAVNYDDPTNDCRKVEGQYVCRIKIQGVTGIKNSNGEDVYGLPAIRPGAVFIDGSKPENRSDVVGYPLITRPTIEITGEDANFPSTGLIIASKGSIIKGLIIHSFKASPLEEQGGECITILGFQFNPGNEQVFDSSNNRIIANYLATDASGRVPMSTQNDGVLILDGSNNTVGGSSIKDRNVILAASERPAIRIATLGVLPDSFTSADNIVQNNFIGVGVAYENSTSNLFGIVVTSFVPELGSPKNTIIKGNIVSGTNNSSIVSSGGAINTQVIKNIIKNNILIVPGSLGGSVRISNTNGGLVVGNIIKENSNGVVISGTSNNISILKNSIYNNGTLGIDLKNDGVTINDPQDIDTGPNNLQNFPVIAFAKSSKGAVKIQGQLFSEPFKIYRIEFYVNKSPDPTGYGEGQCYLGEHLLRTDNVGQSIDHDNQFKVDFKLNLPNCKVKVGDYITSTATEMIPDGMGGHKPGSTSEFSAAVVVTK